MAFVLQIMGFRRGSDSSMRRRIMNRSEPILSLDSIKVGRAGNLGNTKALAALRFVTVTFSISRYLVRRPRPMHW
jgi:hypothetical protein